MTTLSPCHLGASAFPIHSLVRMILSVDIYSCPLSPRSMSPPLPRIFTFVCSHASCLNYCSGRSNLLQPIISHVVRQLRAGGIRRFVIVLGANGDRIRETLMLLPVARDVRIDFVDLGAPFSTHSSWYLHSLFECDLCRPSIVSHFEKTARQLVEQSKRAD